MEHLHASLGELIPSVAQAHTSTTPPWSPFQIHLPLRRIQDVRSPPVWYLAGDRAAHQTSRHLHIPHLLFTRFPFIIKDNSMDGSWKGARNINQAHPTKKTQGSDRRSQHLLVCGAKTYCMSWVKIACAEGEKKCKSKQKKPKGGRQVGRKQVSWTQRFGSAWWSAAVFSWAPMTCSWKRWR